MSLSAVGWCEKGVVMREFVLCACISEEFFGGQNRRFVLAKSNWLKKARKMMCTQLKYILNPNAIRIRYSHSTMFKKHIQFNTDSNLSLQLFEKMSYYSFPTSAQLPVLLWNSFGILCSICGQYHC